MRVDIEGGKYTVVMEDDGRLHALRYGEEWRDLVGDKLVLAMAQELNESRKKATVLDALKDWLLEDIDMTGYLLESGNIPSTFDPNQRIRDFVMVVQWIDERLKETNNANL